MKQHDQIFILSLSLFIFLACKEDEQPALNSEDLFLDKIEVVEAQSHNGKSLPYSTTQGPLLFLRFGPYRGPFPAYKSNFSKQVTALPLSWNFIKDSIRIQQEEWVIALYEQIEFEEQLLVYQKINLLEYESPLNIVNDNRTFHLKVFFSNP